MTEGKVTGSAAVNDQAYSVSELSQALKRTVEGAFSHVRVTGEIAKTHLHRSGHMYVTLKDENAVVEAVAWAPKVPHLGLTPELGMEVIATGRLSTYAPRSQYQLVLESLEHAGLGAILKMIEERKARLQKEGWFDESKKRPIPKIPNHIAVITSPTGAVIRDILHRIEERFPCYVTIHPVPVQGNQAVDNIVQALNHIEQMDEKPGVVILARGGGSMEDLMCFNDETLVKAIGKFTLPLVSAIGHETDTTLVDYVSDMRAPTPTAAAELVTPLRSDIETYVLDAEHKMHGFWTWYFNHTKERLALMQNALPKPDSLLENHMQTVGERFERMHQSVETMLYHKGQTLTNLSTRIPHPKARVEMMQERLQFSIRLPQIMAQKINHAELQLQSTARGLSAFVGQDKAILKRGYVRVKTDDNRPVVSKSGLEKDMGVSLVFHDGKVGAKITEVECTDDGK